MLAYWNTKYVALFLFSAPLMSTSNKYSVEFRLAQSQFLIAFGHVEKFDQTWNIKQNKPQELSAASGHDHCKDMKIWQPKLSKNSEFGTVQLGPNQ